MKFTPLDEEALNAQRGILKEGEADFEVMIANDKFSKSSGQPMIELKLKVWDCEGKEGIIFDYLVGNVQWKLHQFLASVGRLDLYESGDVNTDILLGMCGKALLKLQKDKTGKYPDQMRVTEYFIPSAPTENKKESTQSPASILANEDDIPF